MALNPVKRNAEELFQMDSDLDEIFAGDDFEEEIRKASMNSQSGAQIKPLEHDDLLLTGQLKNLRNNLEATRKDLDNAQTQIVQLQQLLNNEENNYKKEANVELDRLKSLVDFQSEIIKHNSLTSSLKLSTKTRTDNESVVSLSKRINENQKNPIVLLNKNESFKNDFSFDGIKKIISKSAPIPPNYYLNSNVKVDYLSKIDNFVTMEHNIFVEFINCIKYIRTLHLKTSRIFQDDEQLTKTFNDLLCRCIVKMDSDNSIAIVTNESQIELFLEALQWIISNNIFNLDLFKSKIKVMLMRMFKNSSPFLTNFRIFMSLVRLIRTVAFQTKDFIFLNILLRNIMIFKDSFNIGDYSQILDSFLSFLHSWMTEISSDISDSTIFILEVFVKINYFIEKNSLMSCVNNLSEFYKISELPCSIKSNSFSNKQTFQYLVKAPPLDGFDMCKTKFYTQGESDKTTENTEPL